MPYFKRFAHFTKTVEDSNNGSQYVLLNIHNKRFGADFAKYAGPILLLANKEPFSNLSIIKIIN